MIIDNTNVAPESRKMTHNIETTEVGFLTAGQWCLAFGKPCLVTSKRFVDACKVRVVSADGDEYDLPSGMKVAYLKHSIKFSL